MPLDPSISLAVRQPQVESPIDALSKTTSIADMIGQIQERRAQAADYAAQAPIRQAQVTSAMQKIAEDTALKSAYNQSLKPYDPNVGDLEYDDSKAQQVLDSSNIPGIGPASYLMPQFQAQKDAQKTAHRTQALAELKQTNDANDMVAIPAENLLTLNGTHKQGTPYTDAEIAQMKSQYPAFRDTAVKVNPANGKLLPPDFDVDTVPRVVQPFIDQHDQRKDIQDRLLKTQNEEKLALTTPEGREAEITRQVGDFTNQNGAAPDQETLDAIREGVMNKAGFTGFKINRKAPLRATFGKPTDNPPPGSQVFGTDQEITPKPGVEWVPVFHGTDVLGYQSAPALKQTAFEQKSERNEKAYAATVGKEWHGADWSDADAIKADAWAATQMPAKITDAMRKYQWSKDDPEGYAFYSGHAQPGSSNAKPLSADRRAALINAINTAADKQGLTGADRNSFKSERFNELKDHGIDLSASPAAAPVSPQPNRPAPNQPTPAPQPTRGAAAHGATYGPVVPKTLTTGEKVMVRQNLATKKWEEVPQ